MVGRSGFLLLMLFAYLVDKPYDIHEEYPERQDFHQAHRRRLPSHISKDHYHLI